MATDPIHVGNDLAAVVARARRQAEEAGELNNGGAFQMEAELDASAREFLLAIVRDGTYAEAIAELARRDPDLATQ